MIEVFLFIYLLGYLAATFTFVVRNGEIGISPLVGVFFPAYFYYLYEKTKE